MTAAKNATENAIEYATENAAKSAIENVSENTYDLASFRLPRYAEIPDIGLLLDQTVRLVNQYLEPLGAPELTPSMVSNYVKHGIIPRAVKKQYGREQIAYLLFIAVAKTALALDDIQLVLGKQKAHYPLDLAYNRFCYAFENALAASPEGAGPVVPVSQLGGDMLVDLLHDIAAASSMSIKLRMKLEKLSWCDERP